MQTLRTLFLCLSTILFCNTVAAEALVKPEEESIPGKRWMERPVVVEGTVGLFTPTGELGVGVDWSFLPHTSLNLGAGVAYGGVQTAVMFRVRYPWEGDALGIEGGWSGGRFEELGIGCDGGGPRKGCINWSYAHWLNGAVTYEHRAESGFSLRVFLGMGTILNEQCIAYNSSYECFHRSMGYGGLALGYAIDPKYFGR